MDNLFFTGRNLGAARHNIQIVSDFLQDEWQLNLKSGSIDFLVPHNSPHEADPLAVTHLHLLGHDLEGNGCSSRIIAQLSRVARTTFYRNAGCAPFRMVRPVRKFVYVNSLLISWLHWLAPLIWSSASNLEAVDGIQRGLALICIRIFPRPEETN